MYTQSTLFSSYNSCYLCRYSKVTTSKPLKTSWAEKMKRKAETKSIKDYEKQLKDSKAKEKEVHIIMQGGQHAFNIYMICICKHFQNAYCKLVIFRHVPIFAIFVSTLIDEFTY